MTGLVPRFGFFFFNFGGGGGPMLTLSTNYAHRLMFIRRICGVIRAMLNIVGRCRRDNWCGNAPNPRHRRDVFLLL